MMAREDPYRFPLPRGPANMDGERATISLITMRSHVNEVRTLTLTNFPNAANNDIAIRRASKRGSRGDYRTPAADNSCYESQVVSREHAFIVFDPDTNKAVLKDNYSTHGTWLNGRQLAPGGSEPLPDHSYIRCGVDVIRGAETFAALVIEVVIHWADDPNYQSYFPLADSYFERAHKWGPQTIYGEHLPVTPPMLSSNTFRVPDDSDIEELPEEAYVEDLEELNDSDVEEVTMAVFSPPVTDENVAKVNDAGDSATSVSKPAEAYDIKNITNPYPSPTYPTSIPACLKLNDFASKTDGTENNELPGLVVEADSRTMTVPPIMSDPEDNSEDDSEENSEDEMESDSDDSQWPEVWNKSRSDDETDDIEGESYQEDDSDESGEISDGSEDSDDDSEPEIEAPKPKSVIEPATTEKCIDPGLLVRGIASSSKTPTSVPPTQVAAVNSPNTLDQMKAKESREFNSRLQLPPLEDTPSWPVNTFMDCSFPQPRGCIMPSPFSVADRIYDPIRDPMHSRKTDRATYTDGPFQSPVASKVPSLIDGLNQLPCASLKRKASKLEVNDHEDKIVISATESPVDTKQSDAVNAITSALSESEPEPSSKRVKTSHPPSKIASHATTAVVGAVLGALSTIALLAALPTEYFQ